MPNIKHLSPQEAKKIAAGEVVERPVNIVKELIENSIDAHATSISIHLKDGGKQLIRVVDNGCGMDKDDALIAPDMHATSKIQHINELETINTFGFRGEALASIAATSRMTLQTCNAKSNTGIRVTVDESGNKKSDPVACPVGTDIEVKELFYAIPARKKFLKKRETELRQIVQLVHAFSFTYPHVRFKLSSDGNEIINCAPTEKPIDRCALIWKQSSNDLLEICAQRSDKTVKIEGYISNHQIARYDRAGIFFFVNNRWINNRNLTRALMNGYQSVLQPGKFPLAMIHISVDPTLVDINVHPRKEEVAFLHPRMVETLITTTVKKALEDNLSSHLQKPVELAHTPTFHPEIQRPPMAPSVSAATTPSFTPFNFDTISPDPFVPQEKKVIPIQTATATPEPQQNTITHEAKTTQHQIIGQLNQTYILVDHADGLFVVDQHAAHERILYELFEKEFKKLPTIQLLFPQTISLNEHDCTLLAPHLDLLRDNAIEINEIGNNQLSATALPVHLKEVDIQELCKQFIGWIKEDKNLDQDALIVALHKKLRAQMACKATVKAGDTLTHDMMTNILRDLNTCPNRLTCPHGRPTGWLLGRDEIERKFKRRK